MPVTVRTDYNGIGKILYRVAEAGYVNVSTDYADLVTAVWLVPQEECNAFLASVNDATQGKAEVAFADPVWYSEANGKLLLPPLS